MMEIKRIENGEVAIALSVISLAICAGLSFPVALIAQNSDVNPYADFNSR